MDRSLCDYSRDCEIPDLPPAGLACAALSPFRLGEQPNIRAGVAMITLAPEALALHEKMAQELWQRALKGAEAVRFMRELMDRQRA